MTNSITYNADTLTYGWQGPSITLYPGVAVLNTTTKKLEATGASIGVYAGTSETIAPLTTYMAVKYVSGAGLVVHYLSPDPVILSENSNDRKLHDLKYYSPPLVNSRIDNKLVKKLIKLIRKHGQVVEIRVPQPQYSSNQQKRSADPSTESAVALIPYARKMNGDGRINAKSSALGMIRKDSIMVINNENWKVLKSDVVSTGRLNPVSEMELELL